MKIKGLRWYIVGLLGLVTALNYFDRQTLALLAGILERDWGITTVEYSYITAAWMACYTVMGVVSGRLIDWMGARRGFTCFVSLWSVADALHAFARNFIQFCLCRMFLGAAEAANFPAGVKAATEWFPMRERTLAIGILNSGTAVGAALAAPVVAWITIYLGWRWAFVAGSALSMLWLLAWLALYRSPRNHPNLRAEELATIEDGRDSTKPVESVPLMRILSLREAWGCILARVLTDPISYLFAFWIPKFLQQERGFDLATVGRCYWIPYVGLAVGNIMGGLIPNFLIGRGWSLNRSRKAVMLTASCVIAGCFLGICEARAPVPVISLLTCAMFAHAAWANMAIPAEVFPQGCVGSVAGCAGSVSSLVGVGLTLLVGRVASSGSFVPVFVVYAFLPMTGFIAVCTLVKKLGCIKQIES